MTTQLPQELIEAILDHVADDFRSLKACSLVCHAWLSRSRWHLFKTYYLTSNMISGFCEVLRAPGCTFWPYIRHINALKGPWEDAGGEADAADLRRLTGVRTLTISGAVDVAAYESFRTFLGAFPTVIRVVFLSLNFPRRPAPLFDIISLFPALKELFVRRLRGTGTAAEPSAIAVPPMGLHKLELSEQTMCPTLAWLLAFNRLPNIDSVTLSIGSPVDVPVVLASLQQLSRTAHLPRIHPTSKDVTVASIIFDFSIHPNLKILEIRGAFSPDQVIHFVTTLAAPALEGLALYLLNLLSYGKSDFTVLDAFLTPGRFPHLCKVVIMCKRERTSQFLRSAMPLLNASGVLAMA